nr:MAG TPA: hypothetical protein [Caudoviricetes sp.]
MNPNLFGLTRSIWPGSFFACTKKKGTSAKVP